MLALDIQRQVVYVPVPASGTAEENLRLRPAGLESGDAPVGRVEELVRLPQRVAERILGLADVLQVALQAIEELERR